MIRTDANVRDCPGDLSRFTISQALIALAMSLFLQCSKTSAATVVSGEVSGRWGTNGSPYFLSAQTTVSSNKTLNIEPGVEIILGVDVNLSVEGQLNAIGTPDFPITFRGSDSTHLWGSIVLYPNGVTNHFRFCRVRDSGYSAIESIVFGGNRIGAVELFNCDLANTRSAALRCTAWGVAGTSPDAGSGTLFAEVQNCVFATMVNGCILNVVHMPGNPQADELIVFRASNNVFRNLSETAISLFDASPGAMGTNISRAILQNNTFVNCSVGIAFQHPVFAPIVHNNIFVGSSNALQMPGVTFGQGDIAYNCFFSNKMNFAGFASVYGALIQNNHNGDASDAYFNIFLNPLCTANPFSLAGTSPCIDAGDPAIADTCMQLSHGSTISDIGALGGPAACGWLDHGFAPLILKGLSAQSSCIGGSVAFDVESAGSEPMSYRWLFNGTNGLAGKTNAHLQFVNLQTSDSGLYAVVISNEFGSVTSSPARLVVSDACTTIGLYWGLTVSGMTGRTYVIDSATNITDPSWLPAATNVLTSSSWLFIDTNTPTVPRRYFRVRLLP